MSADPPTGTLDLSVPEVADLARLHARAQGVPAKLCRQVLAGVRRIDGDGAGSWSAAWTGAADAALAAGRPLAASRLYTLARFPYPATEGQRAAGYQAVAAFEMWSLAQRPSIDRHEPRLLGLPVPVWTSGLDTTARKPLLVVLGGIVSTKEQWSAFLGAARRLGMAVVVAELPGVGENPLRYGPDSHRMLAELVDAVAAYTPIDGVYAVAMSFGGTTALRWAARDGRVRGIVTVGAPVSRFFRDPAWWAGVPDTTRRTLAHVTGVAVDALPAALADHALAPDELRAVTAPVAYVRSLRDEIVPAADSALLAASLPRYREIVFDDVHGSPRHLTDTKLWIIRSLLAARGGSGAATALLDAALAARRVLRRPR